MIINIYYTSYTASYYTGSTRSQPETDTDLELDMDNFFTTLLQANVFKTGNFPNKLVKIRKLIFLC